MLHNPDLLKSCQRFLPLLFRLEMLIQRDSVISWSSHSSSCYLSLTLLRHAPALRLPCRQSDPTSPRLPSLSASPSLRLLSLCPHTHLAHVRVCVCDLFLCAEKWCSILFLISPSCPLSPKQEYSVYMHVGCCQMCCHILIVRDLSSSTHTHTLGWKTKVTLWIRLPCSALEGHKAPDRFTVSIVCCWSSLSLALLVLQLEKLVDFKQSFTDTQKPDCPCKLQLVSWITRVKLKKKKVYKSKS